MIKRGMIGENIVGGAAFDPPHGCDRWLMLTLAVLDRACLRGFTRVGSTVSMFRKSVSRAITMTDRHNRIWRVRVSNHYLPDRARRCHFNLVSRDGLFGRAELLDFVDRVAAGSVEWFDCVGTEKPVSAKLKQIIRAAQ